MPTVKKEGSASDLTLSIDEIRSFLESLHIEATQLSQLDTGQLREKVAATKKLFQEKVAATEELFREQESKLFFLEKGGFSREYNEVKHEHREFLQKQHEFSNKLWHIPLYIIGNVWMEQIKMRQPDSIEAIVALMHDCIRMSEDEPIKLCNGTWIFKGFHYSVDGLYSDEQFRLLIIEEFDKERRFFEKLKQKHDPAGQESTRSRIRVPEHVRVEVWRRDSGKCTRCDSRENLEYDHIIPLSRGGSNTARNIELLCEKCNRSKGANIG